LALILAHELGHILLHDDRFDRGPDVEIEADAAGLALIARADYDLDVAIAEMDRFGRTLAKGSSGTHPVHAERVAALRERQIEINSGVVSEDTD
jgi:predicted Zn-dependent protease